MAEEPVTSEPLSRMEQGKIQGKALTLGLSQGRVFPEQSSLPGVTEKSGLIVILRTGNYRERIRDSLSSRKPLLAWRLCGQQWTRGDGTYDRQATDGDDCGYFLVWPSVIVT
jgi:hypothetical protein